jgi:DNA invertase Pin-like site-specific DNA recombinase
MRTAVYIRVSKEIQSTEMQMRSILPLLQLKGIADYEIYSDHGLSGASKNRPALNKLLDDCKGGKIELVVVYKLDRLFRSLVHLLDTLALFKTHSVQFISVSENIDLSTPTGQLMMHIVGAMAQFERALVSERTKAGLVNARAKGRIPGPKPQYTHETASLVLDLRKDGKTYQQISNALNLSIGSIQRIIKKAA